MLLPPKWYQFLVSLFAALGSLLFGYDLGVIASIVAAPAFIKEFNPSAAEQGAVVSLFTGGAFFGAFGAGLIADRIGRRGTIVVSQVIFILGGSLQAGGRNLSYLYSGRFFAGVGVGLVCMIVPLYQAELAHPSIRGRVTALQQFMLGVGALIASWIGYGANKGYTEDNNNQWRIPAAIQVVPAVFLGSLIFLFPESPRWLIDHGREEKGLEVIAQLHAHGNTEDAFVKAEFESIQKQIAYEHEHEAKKYSELFTNQSNFRRVLLSVSLQGSIQMTGVSAIQYFSPAIFAQIGISTNQTLMLQGINSALALIAQFCCVLFIDYFGRRWPLIIGMIINGITFIIGAALLSIYPPDKASTGAHWAFIMTTWVFNVSFSATSGPLSWIIPAEVFNTATRTKGVALATMTSFATNTMIGQVTPIAMEQIGWKYYFLFIICNFTNALFFYCLMPETAKVPLEDMDRLFRDAPWFVPRMGEGKHLEYLHDLEVRAAQIDTKGGLVEHHEGEVAHTEERPVEKVAH